MDVFNRLNLFFIFFIFSILFQSSIKIVGAGSVVLQPQGNTLSLDDRIIRTPSLSIFINSLLKVQDRLLTTDNDDQKLIDPRFSNVKNSTSNDFTKYTKLGQPLVKIGNGLYHIETKNSKNFFEADQICKLHGLVLVSLETEYETKNVQSHLTKNYPLVKSFWTSGNDLGNEGTFVWLSTGLPLTYSSWLPAQPDNAGKDENCIELWSINDQPLDWNDRQCSYKCAFVCELVE